MTDDERIVAEEIAQAVAGVLRDAESTLTVEAIALRILPHLANAYQRPPGMIRRADLPGIVTDAFALAEEFAAERDRRGLLRVREQVRTEAEDAP